MQIIERKNLGHILDVLKEEAYDIFGPVIKDSAIVYDQIENVADMPIGWHDKQDKGTYRLEKTEKPFVFAYVGGPQSIKKFLHPAEYLLWKAKKMSHGFEIVSDDNNAAEKRKPAFIGVRSCELHAIQIQDKIFLEGPAVDPLYRQVRNDAFIVAVNCTHPGGTCFCTSMDTGPRVKDAYDIALTEILQGERHYFIAKAGSKKGEEVLKKIPGKQAQENDLEAEEEVMNAAVNQIKKKLDTTNIKELLYVNSAHKHWDDVAGRCLSCGNCTMVCPTCFCSTVEDRLDLTGEHAERWNKRDSCFSLEFSFIHTGPVRSTVSSRYRQWLTHKLGTWYDQFGTSGCVGCGRCITWCPVGIDITEELAAIRNN